MDSAFKVAGLRAASNMDNRLWSEKLSWERRAAYKKWSAIILHEIGAWDIARLEVQRETMEFARGGLLESISDALGAKSTNTLHSIGRGPGCSTSNSTKKGGRLACRCMNFTFTTFLKSCGGRAASFPRSFLLSVNFADHHFGFHGAGSIRTSGRIKGLVDIMYSQRRNLVQRPPLTVKQIRHLESIVVDENRAVFDHLPNGYFLFLVYGRLRYSDGLQVTSMNLDEREDGFGFLECLAEKTKTSVTLEQKVRYIPIAIPLVHLGGRPWVHTWLQLREERVMPHLRDVHHFSQLLQFLRLDQSTDDGISSSGLAQSLAAGSGTRRSGTDRNTFLQSELALHVRQIQHGGKLATHTWVPQWWNQRVVHAGLQP